MRTAIAIDELLVFSVWLCFSAIGFAAFIAVIHANVQALQPVYFLLVQAVVASAVILVLAVCWRHVLSTAGSVGKIFGILLLGVWLVTATHMGVTAFTRHDEIYSWNLWAIKHWQRKPYDLYYTQASYPQLFAYWLASVYGAQDGFKSQLFARLASSLPVLLLVGSALAMWPRRLAGRQALVIGLVCIWMVARTWPTLRLGYADPMMTAGLAVSLTCLMCYVRSGQFGWWCMSVAAAVIAALTKQPAVLWAGGSLPLIALAGWRWNRWPIKTVAVSCGGALLVVWVTFFVTSDITNNSGVIARAIGDRGVLETLGNSVFRYLVKNPDIFLVLSLSWWFSRRITPLIHLVWWLAVLPMIGLWFTLGSYEMRQGAHVIWLSGLLLLVGLGSRWFSASTRIDAASRHHPVVPSFAMMSTLLVLIFSISYWSERSHHDLSDGQKMAFINQMGSTPAAQVYEKIVGNQARVFTTSNYSWGLFYGRTPVLRADLQDTEASLQSLQRLLLSVRADYAISSGDYAYGPYSPWLVKLAEACPKALQEVLKSSDERFTLYEVARSTLEKCRAL